MLGPTNRAVAEVATTSEDVGALTVFWPLDERHLRLPKKLRVAGVRVTLANFQGKEQLALRRRRSLRGKGGYERFECWSNGMLE